MHPTNSSPKPKEFDSIESTIEAFRRGEFIIVLDDQNRENEGDLIIAAEDITTEKMAFMIRYTSGVICAPITSKLAQDLDLPQMVTTNEDPNRTAYTISIDSTHESISTGISAYDRALTCRTLSSKKAKPADFRRPGHVFPLRAKDGGVLVRTGHTEAAIDFCRLAGKAPVGIISEMIEDGEAVEGQTAFRAPGMMRRDACLAFGKKWGLKTCTIEDLVDYLKNVQGKQYTNGAKVPNVDAHTLTTVNGHH